MRWLMKLFSKQSPPERSTSDTPARDPAHVAARQAYLAEKAAAEAKEREILDRLARLNRLGYDFDIAAQRRPEEH